MDLVEKMSLKSQTFVNNSNVIIESPLGNLGGRRQYTHLKENICYNQKRWQEKEYQVEMWMWRINQ